MNRGRYYLLSFVLISCLLLMSVTVALGDPVAVGTIDSVQGEVTLRRVGSLSKWEPVKPPESVFEGDVIRTGADSRAAIVLFDKSWVKQKENTTWTATLFWSQESGLELGAERAFYVEVVHKGNDVVGRRLARQVKYEIQRAGGLELSDTHFPRILILLETSDKGYYIDKGPSMLDPPLDRIRFATGFSSYYEATLILKSEVGKEVKFGFTRGECDRKLAWEAPYLVSEIKGMADKLSVTEKKSALEKLLKSDKQTAVPVLIRALHDKDPEVRSIAASTLGQIGPAAKETVPVLVKLLSDTDPQVREAAALALVRTGPTAVPALVQALQNKDLKIRKAAESALVRAGATAIPALVQALQDKDPEVRVIAATILVQIGPTPKETIPALVQALSDTNFFVRGAAGSALVQSDPTAVPALIQALEHKNPEVRSIVAIALGQIGPKAKDGVPVLIKLLSDIDPRVRKAAVSALGQIGPAAKEALPALTLALHDKDPEVRSVAAYALSLISPEAKGGSP